MKPTRRYAAILFALDAISFFAVFYASAFLRGLFPEIPYAWSDLFFPFLLLVGALYLIDGYKMRTDMMSLDYTSLHMIAIISAATVVLLLTFVFITRDIALHSSRSVLMASFLCLSPLTLVYRRILYLNNLKKRENRSIVFVGNREHCKLFEEEYRRNCMFQPLLLCPLAVDGPADEQIPQNASMALHSVEHILDESKAGRLHIEAIVLRESSRGIPSPLSQRLVGLYFSGIPTYTLELFQQIYWRKIPLYRINQTWLFQEGFKIAREPVYERLKRVADIFLAVIGSIIFSPIVFVAALAVWIEDRQNPFFSQTRIGQNHVPFVIHKLRTMRKETNQGDLYTREGDARITKVGRFLRTSRIDEIPQLWNVLTGSMSLIGPRAEWDKLVEQYEQKIPCYHFRHLVKPGITGWAQINYPYGANLDDTLRKLEYDLYYVKHFSFMLDASIVLKTIHVMIFGKGR